MASQSDLQARRDNRPPDSVMTAVPVTVVMPTCNAADQLPRLLAAIPQPVGELIIVDGHSVDGSIDVARACWPEVRVVHQRGRGKGKALQRGFAQAHGDIIVILAADGSADPKEIPRFVAALLAGADVAKGTRFVGSAASFERAPRRQLSDRVRSRAVNSLWNTNYSDPCFGYGAFWRRCLPDMSSRSRLHAPYRQMNLLIAAPNLKVVEVPSADSNRRVGRLSFVTANGLPSMRPAPS